MAAKYHSEASDAVLQRSIYWLLAGRTRENNCTYSRSILAINIRAHMLGRIPGMLEPGETEQSGAGSRKRLPPRLKGHDMKALLIIALYAIALAAFAAGVDMAPGMTWPNNAIELNAAALLVIGMIAKVAGHVALLGTTGAR